MSKSILLSALLSLVTVGVHIIWGGADVHIPLLSSSLSVGLKAISSVLWHGVSAILIINTIALFAALSPSHHQKPLIVIVSVQYLAFALIFIFYGVMRLDSITIMPQWIVFLLIPALALKGFKSHIETTLTQENF